MFSDTPSFVDKGLSIEAIALYRSHIVQAAAMFAKESELAKRGKTPNMAEFRVRAGEHPSDLPMGAATSPRAYSSVSHPPMSNPKPKAPNLKHKNM